MNLPPVTFDPEKVPRHVVSVAVRALLRCGHVIDKNEARYVVAAVLEADRKTKTKTATRKQQQRPVRRRTSGKLFTGLEPAASAVSARRSAT